MGLRTVHYTDRAPGPGVIVPSVEEVAAAMAGLDRRLRWKDVRGNVIPVLPRERPLPPGSPAPIRILMAPGLAVGFGIDVGPAFMSVNAGLLQEWSISIADLQTTALVNLHARASRLAPADVYHGELAGVPAQLLQSGLDIASVLVLSPGEIGRLFGAEPKLLLAPMRDLLIALPDDVDRAVGAWIHHAIAEADPNCLPPMAFRFRDDRADPENLDAPGPARPAARGRATSVA